MYQISASADQTPPYILPETICRIIQTVAWDLEHVKRWLVDDGRTISNGRALIEGLGAQLRACGAPVWRMRLGSRTIHPQFAALSFTWSADTAHATESQPRHGFQINDSYVGSPFQHVEKTGKTFRRRLTQLTEGEDHQILFDLADQGAQDYLAIPMWMSDGSHGTFVVVTKATSGFSPCDIERLEELALYISPVFEVLLTRRLARNVVDTYVGKRTGARVLAGQIKRGDGELIHAAIWFSDLRDFTPLTERLPATELLDLLNTYFEAVTVAVTARGGEVLRFIGDAMLIVFPVSDSVTIAQSCDAALDAAQDAFDSIAVLNARRRHNKQPQIVFGLGLHIGEVIYGNVGAPDRLDFTVMGPAVNRAARLEGLTKSLGDPILMSAKFASLVRRETQSRGLHTLRGVDEQQEIFRPVDEA